MNKTQKKHSQLKSSHYTLFCTTNFTNIPNKHSQNNNYTITFSPISIIYLFLNQ
jgi:hypothetical protein